MNAEQYLRMKERERAIHNETKWQTIYMIMAIIALGAVVLV